MTPKEALAALVAAFMPNKDLPQPTIDLYVAKMGDIGPELLAQAVHRLIMTKTFFPAIAEIRQTALEVSGRMPLGVEQAMAIVRQADITRPVYRRDGTYAYTEHEWDWPKSLSWDDLAVIRAALAKSGDSIGEDGERIFAWDTTFKEHYEVEANAIIHDLNLKHLKPLPTSKPPKMIPPPVNTNPPRPGALKIVMDVAEGTITEEEGQRRLREFFGESESA